MEIKMGDMFVLLDNIEAGNGGPDTILFRENSQVVCKEIRNNDILLIDDRGAGFYLNKSDIGEFLNKIQARE